MKSPKKTSIGKRNLKLSSMNKHKKRMTKRGGK
jgi:hypothetical protein